MALRISKAMAATWTVEMTVTYAPNADNQLLHHSHVRYLGPSNDGTSRHDLTFPADWVYPLRMCRYGVLTLLCPNRMHEILLYTYGPSFMVPKTCKVGCKR